MPSPFPGMDPYLEDPEFWSGFQRGFLSSVCALVNGALPAAYSARLGTRGWLRRIPCTNRLDRRLPANASPPANGIQATPYATLLEGRKEAQALVEIVASPHARLTGVIELLTPENKEDGCSRNAYLARRSEHLASTSFVEIDLLRSGNRMAYGHPSPPTTDYFVMATTPSQYPSADVWAFSVVESCPVVAVPFDEEFDPIPLSLRECLDRAYDDGEYATRIDYTAPPTVPLRSYEAEWAAELLKKSAKKKTKK